MDRIRFAKGEHVFRRGEPASRVYVVKSGQLAILAAEVEGGGSAHEVARLGPGEVVGEMAVLEGVPHGSTVRAVGDVEVVAIDRQVFLETLRRADGPALDLLRSTVARLRAMNRRAERDAEPVALAWTHIRVMAGSDQMAAQMPPKGFLVRNLPFRVGLHHRRGDKAQAAPLHLALDDDGGHLEAAHFEIEDAVMGPVVRDLGTRSGTTVNGVPLGGASRRLVAPLRSGKNEIVVGPPHSTCRIRADLDGAGANRPDDTKATSD